MIVENSFTRDEDLMRYADSEEVFQSGVADNDIRVLVYVDGDLADGIINALDIDGVNGVTCETTLANIVTNVIDQQSNMRGGVDHAELAKARAALERAIGLIDEAMKRPSLSGAIE